MNHHNDHFKECPMSFVRPRRPAGDADHPLLDYLHRLFDAHVMMCGKVVRRFLDRFDGNLFTEVFNRLGGKEGALQSARVALWEACLRFNHSRGWKFSTYGWTCVYRQLQAAAMPDPLVWAPPTSRFPEDAARARRDPLPVKEDVTSCVEDDRAGAAAWAAEALLSRLSPEDARLLMGHFGLGRSFHQMAPEEGVSHETLRCRCRRALRRARGQPDRPVFGTRSERLVKERARGRDEDRGPGGGRPARVSRPT